MPLLKKRKGSGGEVIKEDLKAEEDRLRDGGRSWQLNIDGSFVMRWKDEENRARSIYFSEDRSVNSVNDEFGDHSEDDLRDSEIAYRVAKHVATQEESEERERKVSASKDAMTARQMQEEEDQKAEMARAVEALAALQESGPRNSMAPRGSRRVDPSRLGNGTVANPTPEIHLNFSDFSEVFSCY